MSLTLNICRGACFLHTSSRRLKERGVAAIEFALTLPIWVALLLGTTDSAYMMLQSQRTDRIAYTVNDLITQLESPSPSDIDTILTASGQLMQPFPFGSNGVVIVTSLYKETGQPVAIQWQRPGGGSLARASKIGRKCLPPQLPDGLTLNDKENVIVVEVYYAFHPIFVNAGILEARDFYRMSIYKPRLGKLVVDPWGVTC